MQIDRQSVCPCSKRPTKGRDGERLKNRMPETAFSRAPGNGSFFSFTVRWRFFAPVNVPPMAEGHAADFGLRLDRVGGGSPSSAGGSICRGTNASQLAFG
jgi:hypothetical protein